MENKKINIKREDLNNFKEKTKNGYDKLKKVY